MRGRCQIALLLAIFVCVAFGATAQYVADTKFEQELLSTVNGMRANSGLPALRPDARLKQAALKHLAKSTAGEGEFSDLSPGEPPLRERILAEKISCTNAGEILLKIPDTMTDEPRRIAEALQTQETLKQILDPRYSTIGIATAHSDFNMYAVAYLADSFRGMPIDDAEKLAKGLQQSLKSKNLPAFRVRFKERLRRLACEAAKTDSLEAGIDTTTPEQSFVFTTADPEHADLLDAIADRQPRSAIRISEIYLGGCFASSKSFPEGRYWFVVWLVNPQA
jgi:uncharacterized protein YkwD